MRRHQPPRARTRLLAGPIEQAHPWDLLGHAARLEQIGGASHMPDVEADLTYAGLLLRRRAGQPHAVDCQPYNVEKGRVRGRRDVTGRLTHKPGWARPRGWSDT